MEIPNIDNLKITKISKNVYLAHQVKPPFYFSCCDGLIVTSEKQNFILDLNIEPQLIEVVNDLFGPIENYVCTHGHMDHIAHVHKWESLGARIYAPFPEHRYLLNLVNFYKGYGWNEGIDYDLIQKFAELNRFKKCNDVESFSPGTTLRFKNESIETLPLFGHSKAHIGFFLPKHEILHISCLGFDLMNPDLEGFGPWYGFQECSIDQYLQDIKETEKLFLNKAKYLTTSHSYVVKNPDITPFKYMKKKIQKNQLKVDQGLKALDISSYSEKILEKLLDLDLFFPKKKMDPFRRKIWSFWEGHIIKKHLEKSSYLS